MSYKHKPGGQKHKNHHKKHPRKGKDPGKGKPKLSKYARIDQTTTSLRAQYENYNSEAVQSFQDLPLSSETLAGLKEAGYTVPTQIQRESIVLALQGNDILGEFLPQSSDLHRVVLFCNNLGYLVISSIV